jgi:hypothetical protein
MHVLCGSQQSVQEVFAEHLEPRQLEEAAADVLQLRLSGLLPSNGVLLVRALETEAVRWQVFQATTWSVKEALWVDLALDKVAKALVVITTSRAATG